MAVCFKENRTFLSHFLRVWQNFENTSFLGTGDSHYPAECMYNQNAKNIEIVLERKVTHRRHGMTTEEWSLGETRRRSLLSHTGFYLYFFGDFLWRRHIAFPPSSLILIFCTKTETMVSLVVKYKWRSHSKSCQEVKHFCIGTYLKIF